jgi:DNA repair exonuclease SbcCD ATPase subunit
MLDKTQAARARIRVTAKLLDAADKAQSALDLARARAEAQAVTIEAHPDGPAALRDGQPLPAGSVPILAETEITLPGFGRLHINPGRARGADSAAEMTRADQDLARLLAEAQVDTLTSARSQWAEAQRLDAAAEDVATLTKALTAAEAEEQIARAEAKTAHDLAVTAGETRAAAEANHKSAERQFASALSEAGDPDALAALLAELKTRQPALASACVGAEGALDRLRATAPDLATTEARLTRARGAVEQAARDLAKAREDLASLNATIAALAEEGIEERLASLAEARAEAEAGAARYEAEVRALTRLRRALDEARTLARDAYFGPVLRELQPLLSILYPGAQLTIDDTSLLPATLTRNGQAESLDILSGGTREQVAILTRLAFARLFAASGRPVPVILDDALVHSDDDRIEAMFDALHRTGRDQQILVLTCRQRAFAALGGTRAEVTIDAT